MGASGPTKMSCNFSERITIQSMSFYKVNDSNSHLLFPLCYFKSSLSKFKTHEGTMTTGVKLLTDYFKQLRGLRIEDRRWCSEIQRKKITTALFNWAVILICLLDDYRCVINISFFITGQIQIKILTTLPLLFLEFLVSCG